MYYQMELVAHNTLAISQLMGYRIRNNYPLWNHAVTICDNNPINLYIRK